MAHCGDKPKRIAFGVAPLGIISIGIVPMGVVSIGVVPMGVISIGVVGMGVLNACVVGMCLRSNSCWPTRAGRWPFRKRVSSAARACTPWATSGCRAQSIQRNIPHTNTDSRDQCATSAWLWFLLCWPPHRKPWPVAAAAPAATANPPGRASITTAGRCPPPRQDRRLPRVLPSRPQQAPAGALRELWISISTKEPAIRS